MRQQTDDNHNAMSRHPSPKEHSRRFYRTIWRWHFYAGLFCIPFVLILSVTGAIYLFKPQIDSWNERSYRNLSIDGEGDAGGARATPNDHIASALESVPHAQFLNYRLTENPDDAVAIQLQSHGESWRVYVHPYSGEVLNRFKVDQQFIQWVRAIHGELLIGRVGSILVELAACWAVILLITGLYLWWPRSAKGMAGVVYPRLTGGRRLFWRDLHAVTGIWIAAFTLFLLITALPWTEVWGSLFKEAKQWNSTARAELNWTQNAAQERHHWEQMAVDNVNLSPALLAAAQALNFEHPLTLTVDDAERNVWKLSSTTQNQPKRADAWLDGATGEVERVRQFSERGLLDRVVGIGIAAHEGQLFGWFNQLLGLLTATGLVLMSVSGFVLWRQRKPEGALGAPALRDSSSGRVVAGLVVGLGVLLPVVGISLIVLMLLEFLALRRIRPVALWLGCSLPERKQ